MEKKMAELEKRLPWGCECGNRWGGYNTAHCTVCHETFTTVRNFDRHRQGTWANRSCAEPGTVGLVEAGRKYPCWMMPGRIEDDGDDE